MSLNKYNCHVESMYRSKQRGISSVEMAIVAVVFFTIVLGAIEISRLLFTWNTLDAIAQRAARIAVVCPPNHTAIRQVAMFGSSTQPSTILPDLQASNINIEYLDSDFNDTGGGFPIEFVRVSIVNFQTNLAIPLVNLGGIASPAFSTVLPAESMGWVPDTGSRTCFGTA